MLGKNTGKKKKKVGFFVSSKMIKIAFIDFMERESEDARFLVLCFDSQL